VLPGNERAGAGVAGERNGSKMKILIVGAGIFGATCARLLTDAGSECLVVEARDHIAGNCYTRWDSEARCNVHQYGAHIFHTADEEVWRFISRFAEFNRYNHRLKSIVDNSLYSYPINLMTLYQIFDVRTPSQARAALAAQCVHNDMPSNMEEACLAMMGPTLYHLLIENYTKKQWNRHPVDLSPDLAKRVTVRTTFDDRLFGDAHQGIPIGGYTSLIAGMLRGITVETGRAMQPFEVERHTGFDLAIYTGAIDEFFGYSLGALEYRSLHFEHELLDVDDYQGNAVINFPGTEVMFTRIIEHKHFDLASGSGKTIVTREYPCDWAPGLDRFYPIGTPQNEMLAAAYRELAARKAPTVLFGGRLGAYKYFDMDKAVASAFGLCRTLSSR
jgi:UDP-galactopyranose mutase